MSADTLHATRVEAPAARSGTRTYTVHPLYSTPTPPMCGPENSQRNASPEVGPTTSTVAVVTRVTPRRSGADPSPTIVALPLTTPADATTVGAGLGSADDGDTAADAVAADGATVDVHAPSSATSAAPTITSTANERPRALTPVPRDSFHPGRCARGRSTPAGVQRACPGAGALPCPADTPRTAA